MTANSQIYVTLLIKLHCSECCECHGDCHNIVEIVADNDSDDNLDWLCSCNLQWTLDFTFYDDIAGECVYFWIHFIFSVYNPFYSVTCGEPTITITFKNQEENMAWIVHYIQIKVICIFLVHGLQVRIVEQFTFYYFMQLWMNNTWYNCRVDVN